MSNSAAEAAERNERDERDERNQLVLRLGAAGLGRAEIAKALRLCPEALDQREAEDPTLAAALRGAAGLSQAWWEALAREACENGRFTLAAWSREMKRRFGEPGPGPDGKTARLKGGRSLLGERPRVTYLLPCNGMTKLNPDGTCPCDSCHDEAFWAAEEAAYDAEDADERPDPELDDEDDDDNDDVLENQP